MLAENSGLEGRGWAAMEQGSSSLLETVRRVRAAGVEVLSAEFSKQLEGGPNVMPAKEWVDVVEFAAEQAGRWGARWDFSPAASPDALAEAEQKRWNEMFEGSLRALVEQMPAIEEPMRQFAKAMAFRPVLERRIASGKGRPVSRVLFVLQSKLGILASRIGLDGLGRALYQRGLYPRGSVGRSSG